MDYDRSRPKHTEKGSQRLGNILYAEDEQMMRDLMSSFLESQFPEYNMETFKDGEELKNRLKSLSKTPECNNGKTVVLTDNDMPYHRGIDLISEYSGKVPNSEFILFSGGNTEEKDVTDAGGYSLLEKPANIEEIREAIESAFNNLEKKL